MHLTACMARAESKNTKPTEEVQIPCQRCARKYWICLQQNTLLKIYAKFTKDIHEKMNSIFLGINWICTSWSYNDQSVTYACLQKPSNIQEIYSPISFAKKEPGSKFRTNKAGRCQKGHKPPMTLILFANVIKFLAFGMRKDLDFERRRGGVVMVSAGRISSGNQFHWHIFC